MSLPGDAMPNTAPAVALLSPDSIGRSVRIIDYEQGGIALNDPSQGLQVQNWRARLVGNEIKVGPDPYTTETTVVTASGITQLSLAFDQNMNPAVAYVKDGVTKLFWYSTSLGAMTTTTFAADVKSPFVCMDDKRGPATTININDVLMFYIRSNRLCYRQQRDSYNTERTLAWFDGTEVTISKVGMNVGLRMQVELIGTKSAVASGAVLGEWTEAIYLASVTAIARNMPTNLLAGDVLYAALVHRSAATPPAGWTLLIAQACTETAITQTLSIFKKDTTAPGDSGVSASFSQGSSGIMGLMYFALRATTGTVNYLSTTAVAVNDTATNTVTAPIAAAAGNELCVMIATTINASATVNQPAVAGGMSLISGAASQTRIGLAYQRRTIGRTNSGRFTFDLGSPVNNGLAAMTMRFGVV